VNVRPASEADLTVLRVLYGEFFAEHPPPPYRAIELDHELAEVEGAVARGEVVLLAEEDGEPVGFSLARANHGAGYISDLFVRPAARARGTGKALLAAAVEALRQQGLSHVALHVDESNAHARAFYDRLGFRTETRRLVIAAGDLLARVGAREPRRSQGAIYVQTDDDSIVTGAVAKYLPRIGRSGGTTISKPRNGWIRIEDELCSREPNALRRLGRELSLALGLIVLTLGIEEEAVVRYVLWDRGGIADEYASVPEYYGPLPPGDVIALAANPTVARRLTGADPARVRAVARTAATGGELPSPDELLAQVADVLGVVSAE
jgi:ribosomal protein S18 acetylase RimI-like enzyme